MDQKQMKINPMVIDVSHHNQVNNFEEAYEFGIRGVIHKASEGDYSADKTYTSRRIMAKKANLLWGAYHFSSGDAVKDQVELFMNAAKPDDNTLMVLDYEQNFGKHGNMNVIHAIEFMHALETKISRECAVYSGNWLKESIAKLNAVDKAYILSRRLWLCHYTAPGKDPVLPKGFKKYWLWQYTGDGQGNPPHNVPGIIAGNKGLDINSYDGTVEQLTKEWAGNPL